MRRVWRLKHTTDKPSHFSMSLAPYVAAGLISTTLRIVPTLAPAPPRGWDGVVRGTKREVTAT